MPHGPKDDNYQIYLYVLITDDSDGVYQYYLSTPVTVLPNDMLIQKFTDAFLEDSSSNSTSNSTNQFLEELKNSDVATVSTFISSFNSIINSQIYLESSNNSNNSNNVIFYLKLFKCLEKYK